MWSKKKNKRCCNWSQYGVIVSMTLAYRPNDIVNKNIDFFIWKIVLTRVLRTLDLKANLRKYLRQWKWFCISCFY
jgi:hypothetical protein